MTKLDHLRDLLSEDSLHHATYRNHGSIWEGLYIYIKSSKNFRFEPCLVFGKNDPDLTAAENIVRHTGISFGAYGKG